MSDATSKNCLFLDYEYCTGCHSCEIACRNELELGIDEWGIKVLEDGPRKYEDGTWQWNYYAVPGEKCDMCVERVSQGLEPSCVQHCQAKVLKFGTIEECAQMLADKGGKALVLKPQL
ncbi:MAG: 4Fe-4S dicluster domain-containing protein [Coriobacteriales bacterium]|jgi:Fe-S-cluster-containing dehydrogenase component